MFVYLLWCLIYYFCFRDPNNPAAVSKPWPTFDLQSRFYLNLNTKPSIQSKMEATRTAFWTELAPRMLRGVHNFHTSTQNMFQNVLG